MTIKLLANGYSRRLSRLAFTLLGLAAGASMAQAQSTGTGTIAGRVFNPTDAQYVRDVEVSVQGTQIAAVTADDGSYRLVNVPAGTATVVISYSGFEADPAVVTVNAGQTASQDFSLRQKAVGDVIKLSAFTVSDTVEGNAKNIQEQKESMNVSNIVASETFGNIAEGNVGEFLKYLPAVDLDYVEADPRNPRLRGLPSQYTSVTYNGMALASADGFIQNNGTDNGGGAGVGDRSFGFEQVSMSNVDSIEVNFTTNASQDANSPAGNINLRPRHAYEQKGQHIDFTLQAMDDSEEFYASKQVAPDDTQNLPTRPNANLNYSNSFFNNRLGVVVGLNYADTLHEQREFTPTYDNTPTAADPRPLVLTGFLYKDGPTQTMRDTASFAVDFKATDQLSVSVMGVWNGYDSWVGNRSFGVLSTRANVTGDGLSSWNNVPVTSISSSAAFLNKRTFGHSFLPNFEYKTDHWDVYGALSVSQSVNNYAGGVSKAFPGLTTGGTTISPTGITASAQPTNGNGYGWAVTQTAGPDWGNVNNYKSSATADPQLSEDGRYVKNLIYEASLDTKYTTGWSMPTWFKFGPRVTETTYNYANPTSYQIWNYIGPGGGLGGSWGNFPSAFNFNPGNGVSLNSISGMSPAMVNHNAVGQLFAADPQDFVPAATAGGYLAAYVTNPRYIREQVSAYYWMFNTKPMRRMTVQGGVRYERTTDEVKNFQSVPTSQVVAAGYAVSTSGVATTIPGINYQYFSQPRVAKSNTYGDFFPSASLKYDFTPNLTGLLGYSYTVTRPTYNNLTGVVNIDDENQTISLPNANIKAQYANNYTARLSYYFQSVGSLAIGLFENDFKNFTQTQTLQNAGALYGFTDPPENSYQVTTVNNLPGTVIYRGGTLEYSDSLTFLPKPFNGLSVFANYTRTTTSVTGIAPAILNAATPYNYGWLPGVEPNIINYGASFSIWRVRVGVNARWDDTEPYSGTAFVYQKNRTKIDANFSFRLTDNVSLIANAHNLFDVPDYDYTRVSNTGQVFGPVRIGPGRGIEYYGAYFYAGIRGRF